VLPVRFGLKCLNIVAYLLKARSAETEKRQLLANGSETKFACRQRVQQRISVFYAVRAGSYKQGTWLELVHLVCEEKTLCVLYLQ
jgi:hypothetical protein